MSEFATQHGTLRVHQFGEGRARVVALHGFTLHGAMFGRLAGLLDAPLAAPDLPGHGRSRIAPISMGAAVDSVSDLLATLEAPLLLGYSQGGRVALQIALTHPELVGGLVLVSTSPGLTGHNRTRRRVADEALADRIEAIGMERFVTEWLANPLVATDRVPSEVRAEDRALRLENTAEGVAAALRGMGQASVSDSSERIPGLTMPVVFVAGGNDTRYVESATAMAASRREKPIIVPDVGHNVVLEAPGPVAAVVADMLSGV